MDQPEKESVSSENFGRISIRKELLAEVDRIIEERKHLGYKSKADFVADAVRRRIEEIEKTPLDR